MVNLDDAWCVVWWYSCLFITCDLVGLAWLWFCRFVSSTCLFVWCLSELIGCVLLGFVWLFVIWLCVLYCSCSMLILLFGCCLLCLCLDWMLFPGYCAFCVDNVVCLYWLCISFGWMFICFIYWCLFVLFDLLVVCWVDCGLRRLLLIVLVVLLLVCVCLIGFLALGGGLVLLLCLRRFADLGWCLVWVCCV